MKEAYVKPQLHLESFALSQSIATSCGYTQGSNLGKPLHGDPSSCGWYMGNLTIWVEAEGSPCDYYAGVNDEVNGACYNAPSGMPQIFAS